MYTNSSLQPPDLSPSNASLYLMNTCFTSKSSIYVFTAFSITNLLLLPFFLSVLYLGYQQWRQQCYISTSATSHSNVFMYHAIIMHLLTVLGFTCFFCGGYVNLPAIRLAGYNTWSVSVFGQSLFNILTCLEHYLAVVHPIIYLGLRQPGMITIRNTAVGFVWLLTFMWLPVSYLSSTLFFLIFYCCIMAIMLIVISFCSISTLCALKRPGPGEVGGSKDRVDQSKQRSFRTIMIILGVLLIKFGGTIIGICIANVKMVDASNNCVKSFTAFWINLPSTLVLPMLFLHRIEKLQLCKQIMASG